MSRLTDNSATQTLRPLAGELTEEMRGWSASRWALALASSVLAAVVMGAPTGIIETPLFARMTPVTWWDYPVWATSSVLIGLTAATYVRFDQPEPHTDRQARRTIGAMLLSVTAVGCPVCNKLVVGVIGVSGALNYFAPIQPILGVLSVGLLSIGLAVRIRARTACRIVPPDA